MAPQGPGWAGRGAAPADGEAAPPPPRRVVAEEARRLLGALSAKLELSCSGTGGMEPGTYEELGSRLVPPRPEDGPHRGDGVAAAELATGCGCLPLTKTAADAVLCDFLWGFGAAAFQGRLQGLIDRAIAAGSRDLSNVPGRQELVSQVAHEVLPAHGFPADEAGLRCFLRAIRPLVGQSPSLAAKIEAMERKLHIPKAAPPTAAAKAAPRGGDLEEATTAVTAEAASLTKARALELLGQLLARYTAPDFQRSLEEHRRRLDERGADAASSPRHAFRRLVRREQVALLPLFGFPPTDDGVRGMIAAVERLRGDPDVAVLTGAIDEALFGAAPQRAACAQAADAGGEAEAAAGGGGAAAALQRLSLDRLVRLLRDQLFLFSAGPFQRELRRLKAAHMGDLDDCLHLPGREELVMTVHRDLLPRYGLEGSHRGAQTLRRHCGVHAGDPEVSRLLLETATKLGMGPSARRRYVQQLRTEAGLAASTARASTLRAAEAAAKPAARPAEAPGDAGAAGRPEAGSAGSAAPRPAPAPVGARGLGDEAQAEAAQHTLTLLDLQRRFYTRSRAASAQARRTPPPPAAPQAPRAAELAVAPAPQATLPAAPPADAVPGAPEAPTQGPPAPPAVSKPRAAALIAELELGMKAVFRGPRQLLDRESPEDETRMAQLRRAVLEEVLPRYGFAGSCEGLLAAWKAAGRWLRPGTAAVSPRTAELAERAEGVWRALGGDELDKEEKAALQVCRPQAQLQLVALSEEQAAEIMREVLLGATAPALQKRLGELYRSTGPSSTEFGAQYAELTNPLWDPAFAKRGLPRCSEDAATAFEALGLHLAAPDVLVLAVAIEEALFAGERPSSLAVPGLRSVAAALREQLAAFSQPAFEARVARLRAAAAGGEEEAGGFFALPGRAELAMEVQREVLPPHGFAGSRRGVHALLARASQYAAVPPLMGLLDAINAKLGMDPPARRRFRCRLGAVPEERHAAAPALAA